MTNEQAVAIVTAILLHGSRAGTDVGDDKKLTELMQYSGRIVSKAQAFGPQTPRI